MIRKDSLIKRRPELVLTNLAWSLALVGHYTHYQFHLVPLRWNGLVFVLLAILALNLGFLTAPPFTGEPSAAKRPEKELNPWLFHALPVLFFIGMVFQYRATASGGFQRTLDVVRAEYGELGTEATSAGIGWYMYVLLAPLCLYSIDALFFRKPRKVSIAIVLVFLMAGVVVGAFTAGGRSELMLMAVFAFTAFVVNKRQKLLLHPRKMALKLLLWLFAFLFVNSIFFYFRGGTYDEIREYSYERQIDQTDDMLSSLGLGWLPSPVQYIYGYIYGYFLSPLGYFQYFLDSYDGPKTYGFLQCMLLYNRIGIYTSIPPPMERKMTIDTLYTDIGIDFNVWATGFREMVADFGPIGAVLVIFAVTVLASQAKRYYYEFAPGRVLFLGWTAWCVFSPFSNLFRTRIFEMAMILSSASFIAWLLLKPSKEAAPAFPRKRTEPLSA